MYGPFLHDTKSVLTEDINWFHLSQLTGWEMHLWTGCHHWTNTLRKLTQPISASCPKTLRYVTGESDTTSTAAYQPFWIPPPSWPPKKQLQISQIKSLVKTWICFFCRNKYKNKKKKKNTLDQRWFYLTTHFEINYIKYVPPLSRIKE